MLGEIKFTISTRTSASPEDIIDVLADWHRLPQYWHGMREISESSGRMLNVRFAFPGEGKMSYICDMDSMCCTENYHNGPFSGFKRVEISESESGTAITVKWDIRLATKLILFRRIVEKHLQQGTDHALQRIVLDAENRIKVPSRFAMHR